jgi:riboflavin synthase
MFTGIITATAKVNYSEQLKSGLKVQFEKPVGWDNLVLGESIAVNGVCVTITELAESQWEAFLMPETLAKTSFKEGLPETVNLERALLASDRLSGHIVQGHVDGVGHVSAVETDGDYLLSIEFSTESKPPVVYKGSITINGVSLTVAKVVSNVATVALIPHTLEHTTLASLKVGDTVNLEFDMIGKYVTNFLEQSDYAKS